MLLILYNSRSWLCLLHLGYLCVSSGLHYWTGLCGKSINRVELLSFHTMTIFMLALQVKNGIYWCRIKLKHILFQSDSLHIYPGFCFVVVFLLLLKSLSLEIIQKSLFKILGLKSSSKAWLVAMGWILRTHIWPQTSLPPHVSYQLWICAKSFQSCLTLCGPVT